VVLDFEITNYIHLKILQETDEFNKKYNKSNHVKNRLKKEQNSVPLNEEKDRQQRQKYLDLKAKSKLRKEYRLKNQNQATSLEENSI
jgi:hypothetical protein